MVCSVFWRDRTPAAHSLSTTARKSASAVTLLPALAVSSMSVKVFVFRMAASMSIASMSIESVGVGVVPSRSACSCSWLGSRPSDAGSSSGSGSLSVLPSTMHATVSSTKTVSRSSPRCCGNFWTVSMGVYSTDSAARISRSSAATAARS